MRHTTRRFFDLCAGGLVMACVLGLLLALASQDRVAEAQASCIDVVSVSTEAEFNLAVGPDANVDPCFGGPHTRYVLLLNDIEATSIASPAAFATITGGRVDTLVIEGNGFTLRRSSAAANTPAPLLQVDANQGGAVEFIETNIELGPHDTIGIDHIGNDSLHLRAVSIRPGSSGTNATGVRTATTQSQFLLTRSLISSVPTGLEAAGSTVFIEGSTIASTSTDIRVTVNQGPNVISNSVLAGPVSIELIDGGFHVEHSTIFGDGAFAGTGATADTWVTFLSSIVESCTAPEFLTGTQAGPGWADLENNVGDCFGVPSSPELTASRLCTMPTPAGCPTTAAINVTDAARGAGRCDEGLFGGVQLDHQDQLRTPVGVGCDAGAFESVLLPGDVDANRTTDNADVQALLDWLAGGDEPANLAGGDIDFNGSVALNDALLLAHLVSGG